jgi:hypothetical protein
MDQLYLRALIMNVEDLENCDGAIRGWRLGQSSSPGVVWSLLEESRFQRPQLHMRILQTTARPSQAQGSMQSTHHSIHENAGYRDLV